jgi:hypothetical protein
MSSSLSSYVNGLREAFGRGADKYAAHDRARPVLLDMAGSPGVFTEILGRHLEGVEALNARHYPVVSLEIESNAHFGLVANCWIPLPDHDTDTSTKAIHHHGQLLLTTVTAFGPGYEHWMFTTPKAIDHEHETYRMRLIERAPHPAGHAAFVDANVAHVPFYPASLTITFALWSSRRPTSWKDALKRVPALHKHSETLRDVAAKVGLRRALSLNIPEYFDFYPAPEGFRGMKERLEFGRGPNEDYLYSLFHLIQRTGNEALAAAVRQRVRTNPGPNISLVESLLDDLGHGRPIEGRLSSGHYGLPHANFRSAAVERALRTCAEQSPSSQTAGT